MAVLSIGELIKGIKKHKKLVKVAKGKMDKQTSVDMITYMALYDLYSLEETLFDTKDRFKKYIKEFEENQAKIDRFIADEDDLTQTLMQSYTTDFRGAIDPLLFNVDTFEDRFGCYVLWHYLKVTYGGDYADRGYKEFFDMVENNPHYNDIWKEVVKEIHASDKKSLLGCSEPRVFMPEPSCIKELFSLKFKSHLLKDNGQKIFNKYGELLNEWGDTIDIGIEVFGIEKALEKHVSMGIYSAGILPHYNFHGKYQEAPLRSLDFYALYHSVNDDNPDMVWEDNLVYPGETALKNGDLFMTDQLTNVFPDLVAIRK